MKNENVFNFQLPLIPISQPDLSASQTLASFHQQVMDDSTGSTLETCTNNTTDVVTVTPIVIAKTCENTIITPTTSTAQQVKLPGGATLVAVTDRNADMLLKPKLLEKPHVTITIGDKQIEQPVCLYTNTVKKCTIIF